MTFLFIPTTATFCLECAICKMLRCKKSHRHNLSLFPGIKLMSKHLLSSLTFQCGPHSKEGGGGGGCFSKLSHSQIAWFIFASICFVPSTLLLLFRSRAYQYISSKVRSLSSGIVYSSKYSSLLTSDQATLFPFFFSGCPPILFITG